MAVPFTIVAVGVTTVCAEGGWLDGMGQGDEGKGDDAACILGLGTCGKVSFTH